MAQLMVHRMSSTPLLAHFHCCFYIRRRQPLQNACAASCSQRRMLSCMPSQSARRRRQLLQNGCKWLPGKCRSTSREERSSPAVEPAEMGRQSLIWSGDYTPGDKLGDGKYTFVEVLGRGSNGETYKAVDPEGKEVAVKALSLKRMKDWKQLELFEREAQTLEALSHPGIPRYLDYFEEDTAMDKSFFLVQELAQGKSLADLVQQGWRADEAEARRIARELLTVLEYLASRKPPVTHRDVKPENVVLEGGKTGGRVFLVDFGGVQAAAAGDAAGFGSTIIGTYGYMAPEQFRGAAQPASDLYALGGTLLYLLSGKAPSGFPQERLRLDLRELQGLTPAFQAMLEGLLEPLVEDRLSAADALAVLDGAPTTSDRDVDRMPGARAEVRKAGGSLQIDIPPEPWLDPQKLGAAGFAVAWNSGIAVWTASAIAAGSIAAAAFSIPFWAAGFMVAREAVGSSLASEQLVIGPRRWSVQRTGKFKRGKRGGKLVEGMTRDLKGVRVAISSYVNGIPKTHLELEEGFQSHVFGSGLSSREQRWLADRITKHLQNLQKDSGRPVDIKRLPDAKPDMMETRSRSGWDSNDSMGGSSWGTSIGRPMWDDTFDVDVDFATREAGTAISDAEARARSAASEAEARARNSASDAEAQARNAEARARNVGTSDEVSSMHGDDDFASSQSQGFSVEPGNASESRYGPGGFEFGLHDISDFETYDPGAQGSHDTGYPDFDDSGSSDPSDSE